jgi:hypothetical protein
MPKKDAKTKRTRAKPKNVIQKVIVNVGRGGGRKAPSGPPRPTPLQQAMQFVQSSLARDASLVQAFQQPRQGESLFQSAQVLQRLIDPINARLDLLMPKQEQQGSAFPNMEIHSKHDRQHVADLPDAQLVQPKAPLVPAGPMRMDDPHEAVPLNKVDPALVQEEEEPAQPASVQSTREDLLQALETIEKSQGVKGNQKPREGFMTKRGLVTLVSNITGRQFSPSTNADYDRIKRKAISILREMIAKQGEP